MASSRFHALLIGIDAYDGGASLNGCVNDIDAIQRVLIDQLGIGADRIKRLAAPHYRAIHETDVPEQLPTLANIRAALEELGTDEVERGDRVFIHFSGHGTQVEVVEPVGTRYFSEAILPTDFLDMLERRYLFDWELNALLTRIAARTPQVTVLLDCCCSGGATRGGIDPPRSRPRFWPTREPYSLQPDRRRPMRAGRLGLRSIPGAVQDCVVVAACLDDERARESDNEGGPTHGELTRALLKQFKGITNHALSDLRWGQIWRRVVTAVTMMSPAQHPWISGGHTRRVFGGPPEDGDAGYGITRTEDTYKLDVGSIAGVTEGALVAIYGIAPSRFPLLGSGDDLAARVGLLRVKHAERSSAEAVSETTPFELPPGARARLIAAGRSARIRVTLSPYDGDIAHALSKSSLLEVGSPGEVGDVGLERRADGAWAITDDVFGPGEINGEPMLAVIPSRSASDLAARALEHYYWYSLPLRIAKSCQDLSGALHMKLLDCNQLSVITPADAQNPSKLPKALLPEVVRGGAALVDLKPGDEHGGGDKVCVTVENDSDVDLSVTLVVCKTSGAVGVISQARILARTIRAFWEGDTLGRPFRLWLRDGRDVGVDRLVALGTTDPNASFWHLQTSRTFAQVLDPTRGEVSNREKCSLPVSDLWTSTITVIRLVKSRGARSSADQDPRGARPQR